MCLSLERGGVGPVARRSAVGGGRRGIMGWIGNDKVSGDRQMNEWYTEVIKIVSLLQVSCRATCARRQKWVFSQGMKRKRKTSTAGLMIEVSSCYKNTVLIETRSDEIRIYIQVVSNCLRLQSVYHIAATVVLLVSLPSQTVAKLI